MNEAIVFVYLKDNKVKVLDVKESKNKHNLLINNGWKHSSTLNVCTFLEYLHNEISNEEITYLDFQQMGFVVKHYNDELCRFSKRTNDCEISGKFWFKTNHLMVANWINNEGENCFNGVIHSKRFLFELMVSLSTVSREEILGIGRKYMD